MLPQPDITELNTVNYAAALLIQEKTGKMVKTSGNNRKGKQKPMPKWRADLLKKIAEIRKEISQVAQLRQHTNSSAKLRRAIEKIKRKYNIQENLLEQKILYLHAEVKSLAQRKRNRDNWHQAKVQNKMFDQNAREFYRSLEVSTIEVKEPPQKAALENYWHPMFEEE